MIKVKIKIIEQIHEEIYEKLKGGNLWSIRLWKEWMIFTLKKAINLNIY